MDEAAYTLRLCTLYRTRLMLSYVFHTYITRKLYSCSEREHLMTQMRAVDFSLICLRFALMIKKTQHKLHITIEVMLGLNIHKLMNA